MLDISGEMNTRIIRGSAAIAEFLDVPGSDEWDEVEQLYPSQATAYYLNLIQRNNYRSDPVWKQCMPDSSELLQPDTSFDPLFEQQQMPVPRLIHRFRDRAVLLVTGNCAVRCRFCFRKRFWAEGRELPNITAAEMTAVLEFLRENTAIQEILISGGDPLMLNNERLLTVIEQLKTVPHISVIRIGTRIPVVWPERIDSELIDRLAGINGLWIMTHFNHPCEITPESTAACRKFIKAGIPVLNQTVLLRGVNDDADILERLFRSLIKIQVKPHYLFHVDPVRGVRHFATGIEAGLEILRKFRSTLSSLAVPTFAIDLPEGGGKVSLQPDYQPENGEGYYSITGDKVIPYPPPVIKTEDC